MSIPAKRRKGIVMNTTLEFLSAKYPGVLFIKPVDAGKLFNQSKQSTYNQLCNQRFPVPTVTDHLSRRMIRLSDLATYIDSMAITQPLPPEPRKSDLPKGRPTKVEEGDAKRRGFASVPMMRASDCASRPTVG